MMRNETEKRRWTGTRLFRRTATATAITIAVTSLAPFAPGAFAQGCLIPGSCGPSTPGGSPSNDGGSDTSTPDPSSVTAPLPDVSDSFFVPRPSTSFLPSSGRDGTPDNDDPPSNEQHEVGGNTNTTVDWVINQEGLDTEPEIVTENETVTIQTTLTITESNFDFEDQDDTLEIGPAFRFNMSADDMAGMLDNYETRIGTELSEILEDPMFDELDPEMQDIIRRYVDGDLSFDDLVALMTDWGSEERTAGDDLLQMLMPSIAESIMTRPHDSVTEAERKISEMIADRLMQNRRASFELAETLLENDPFYNRNTMNIVYAGQQFPPVAQEAANLLIEGLLGSLAAGGTAGSAGALAAAAIGAKTISPFAGKLLLASGLTPMFTLTTAGAAGVVAGVLAVSAMMAVGAGMVADENEANRQAFETLMENAQADIDTLFDLFVSGGYDGSAQMEVALAAMQVFGTDGSMQALMEGQEGL